ncbi:proline--tRNA ligase [candidate division bacterium WOR-3 4484_18]|uniref:Proline--tRNA ligase n=1 Tax=candidate division WOR-3 bacterium 4484_18 TaxID=2020626 RepID=A0A257LUZ8_UNCW3|nr:MAG: proline--tRNA ligase [candidate division bacterium WOR-3 4484_18]
MFIPTLKEKPREAEIPSHTLAIRAGLIRMVASGVYSYLPLGWRVLRKIMQIIREEMNRIGGQELLLPALTPAEIWQETGRWYEYGKEMFRVRDRKDKDYALAPTHEEIITDIARREIRSYRDLPQIWYQIQVKFRDELRPRGGVMRAREFIMKDSYSLDATVEGWQRSYNLHRDAYIRIFTRLGLEFKIVSASGGIMGGSETEEFMVPSPVGEDTIVYCGNCSYKANYEIARGIPPKLELEDKPLRKVYTPVGGSVEEISRFFDTVPQQLLKSLLYVKQTDSGKQPIFLLVDGAHDVSETKILKLGDLRPATSDEVKEWMGASIGYISPIGTDIPVYADIGLKGRKGLITGANEDLYHYEGVNIERDIKVNEYTDIAKVAPGDSCPQCGDKLIIESAIEVGHIFRLGTKYSEAMGATFLDRDGKNKPILMGSYGIGVERSMMAIIETHHDEHGIVWPQSVTPFQVLVTTLNPENYDLVQVADNLYKELMKRDIEVLYDDRSTSAGIKLKDDDLIGIPVILILGEKVWRDGMVEIKIRATNERIKVKHEMCVDKVLNIIKEMQDATQ